MESPLPFDELQDDEKSRYLKLKRATSSVNSNSSEAEIAVITERIQREVTAKPILARIVRGSDSLLSVACINLDSEHFHPAMHNGELFFHPVIKCLITTIKIR